MCHRNISGRNVAPLEVLAASPAAEIAKPAELVLRVALVKPRKGRRLWLLAEKDPELFREIRPACPVAEEEYLDDADLDDGGVEEGGLDGSKECDMAFDEAGYQTHALAALEAAQRPSRCALAAKPAVRLQYRATTHRNSIRHASG